MKKLLIPALAVAVASAALPAAAQSYDRHGPSRGHGYEQNYNGWNAIAQRKHNLTVASTRASATASSAIARLRVCRTS